MKRKTLWRSLAVVVLLGVFFFQIHPARAGLDTIAGQDIYGYPIYSTTHRTVNAADWGIALDKSDGPTFNIKAWSCGDGGWTGGTWKSIPNDDPSGYISLKGNGTTPHSFHFCLAIVRDIGAYNDGTYDSNYYDTFDGTLNWDGPDRVSS